MEFEAGDVNEDGPYIQNALNITCMYKFSALYLKELI